MQTMRNREKMNKSQFNTVHIVERSGTAYSNDELFTFLGGLKGTKNMLVLCKKKGEVRM